MLKTEMRNPKSTHIDKMTSAEMVTLIAEENYNAARAVEAAKDDIARAADLVSEALAKGGRLFFIGAGTSGRLGVLDAAECPPTFGTDPDEVVGIIAGGKECMFRAKENAEDSAELGRDDLASYALCEKDAVVGISASGGADYVVGALKYAKEKGAYAIALVCNENSKMGKIADVSIVTDTGAEVVAGSTRMKAGTAHKMVLNMLSTCAMIKNGKVYENMMINLKPTNIKLKRRMIGIVCEIIKCSEERAQELLEQGGWDIRTAIESSGAEQERS